MTKPKTPRLPKNPAIPDYVVERVYDEAMGQRVQYGYYFKRANARADAKLSKATRTRVFRMRFTLVSDVKRKGGAK
jgi:hypothetical protein